MIFKTFDNDIDGVINKIGIFNKSFGEIFNTFRQRKLDINNLMLSGLVGSKKEAKSQVGSIWNYLFGVKSEQDLYRKLIVTKSNIQSFLKDITVFDGFDDKEASNLLKFLQGYSIQVEKTKNLTDDAKVTWQEYFEGLAEGEKWQEKFVQENDLTKVSLDDVKNAQNAAKQSAIAHNNALNQLTIGAKAAKIALNGLKMAGNIIASYLISKVITALFNQISKVIHRSENAIKDLKDAIQEVQNAQDKFISNSKRLSEVEDRFIELSKGVNSYSENIKLSMDDYNEYLKLSQEIADLAPDLVYGYDSQGNALLLIGDNAEQTREKLKELREEQEKQKNQTSLDNAYKIANGLFYSNRDKQQEINRKKEELNRLYDNPFETFNDIIRPTGNNSILYFNNDTLFKKNGKKLEEIFDQVGIKYIEENFLNSRSIDIKGSFTKAQILEAEKLYNDFFSKEKNKKSIYIKGLENDINNDEKELEKSYSSMLPSLQAYVSDNYYYQGMNKSSQNFIDKILPKIDWSEIAEEYTSDEDYFEYINKHFIEPLSNIPDEYKGEINDSFTKLFTFDDNDMNVINFVRDLQSKLDSMNISIDLTPLISDKVEGQNKLKSSIEDISKSAGEEDELRKYTSGFTKEQIEVWLEATKNVTSYKEAIELYEEAWKKASLSSANSDIFSLKDTNDTLTTLGKISESIDTIQNAFSTLNSAIDEYNNSGSISIDTLQSIIALGDNWYDYLLDENGALKLDKESLQKLTVSRLADMKAQIQQNMIDNVKNITDNASAREYLASTNYQVADSIDAVTEAMVNQTLAEKQSLVQSGDLSQENYDLIEKKLRGDMEKSNLLFENISLSDSSLGGGSSSGSGSSSSKSSNTKIDFIEYRLKELEELANKVQSSIDEAVNAGDKNALLGQMQTVDNAKIDTYNKAISYYQKEASSYLEKIPAELREAAKNGAIAITEFIGDNSSEIADYIQQYRDLDNSIAEATEQVSSLRQEIIKLEKEKFDNIVNAFDSIGNIISSNKSIIESQITYLETSGERIGKGYYSSLKEQSNLQLEQLYKERDVLNKQLSTAMSNGVKYGSDEWKDMYSSIQNVDQAIIDTKNDIEGYNNSLRELNWTVFDDTIESIDTISNKLSNLLDLLKTEKVSGDFSGYSKDAITSMSLNAQKMQTANYVIEKTNKEIANLKASYNKGELSVSEYTERLESLENTLWDNISTYNSAKEAIIEIAKARINEEVEAIEKVTEANNKRISKLKEELQAEKDLQNYKRSLLEKQNDISKLQAQINARMGSTDAETIAEREKLEQELADKLKEIKEMQEDQAYDDMMDSLDKEQSAFEEAQQKKIDTLNDSLEDTETLYNNMLNVIFNNTSITYNRLNELSNQYGFILEQNITSPWAKGNMSSNTFRDTVYRNLNGVSDKFTQLQAKADSISFSKLNSQLGSLNLSTLSTMVSLLSSQINVSGITTGIGNIKSAIENLSKTFETSTKKADDAIKKYGELDKAKKGNNFWVFKTLASYGSHDLARSHLSDYSSHGDISVIEYGGKSLIVKWLKGYPTSGQASYNVGMSNGSGYYQRYKRGGEITENQNLDVIARSMGEDHIATIAYKEGERILTPEQNKAFLKMVDFSDLIAKSNIIKPFLPSNLSPIATPSLQIGTLLNVEGSIDKNSLPDVQKMLDKSKAEIFNEFGQMLKNKNGCRPR